MLDGTDDLWIFAYGSLMWRPDFPYEERVRARLYGFHRALCIYSHHHHQKKKPPNRKTKHKKGVNSRRQ